MTIRKAPPATVAAPVDGDESLCLEIIPLPAASKASFTDQQSRPFIMCEQNWYPWCPSVIRGGDGLYHMFHSRWPKRLTFDAWLPNSEIVHAVADRPEGPFRFVAVALPDRGPGRGEWFTAHNPKIRRFAGRYHLYFCQTRGNADDTKREEISRGGMRHSQWWDLRVNQRIFVAVADTLDGPWQVSANPIVEPAGPIITLTVNPAVCWGPDGVYFMIIKGDKPGATKFQRNQALATAPAPSGPWTIQPRPVIDDLDTEDASMWYDTIRRRFYAVYHAHTHIGLVTSHDGYAWKKAEPSVLAPKGIPFDDGSIWMPGRMERPFVLTDESGAPQMLYVACKKEDASFNIALPLRPAHSAVG